MRNLYVNPSKDERERNFFETFRLAMRELNIQNVTKGIPPEPDYLFTESGKRIGLEETSLVDEAKAAIRRAQLQCLRKASQIVQDSGLELIKVEVKFRSDKDPIDIDEAANELAGFLKEKMPEISGVKTWHYYESGLKYSRWVSIRLGTVTGQHQFGPLAENWVERDPIQKIQSRIDAKQLKYPEYIKHCDECWLLVGVNEWAASEAKAITEESERHIFSGSFRRLFFVRSVVGTVTELNISGQIRGGRI